MSGTALARGVIAIILWGSPRFRDANLLLLMVYTVVGFQGLFARQRAVEAISPRGRNRVRRARL